MTFDQHPGRVGDRPRDENFSREKSSTTPQGRTSRAAGLEQSRTRERAVTRGRGSDRHTGVPAGVRASESRAGVVTGFVPALVFGVFEWLAELLAALLEIPGVKVGLLAAVIGAAFYASRFAAWLQIAGSWIRMAAVIGGVGGLAIVLGMSTGAIAVDVAHLEQLARSLLEAIL